MSSVLVSLINNASGINPESSGRMDPSFQGPLGAHTVHPQGYGQPAGERSQSSWK